MASGFNPIAVRIARRWKMARALAKPLNTSWRVGFATPGAQSPLIVFISPKNAPNQLTRLRAMSVLALVPIQGVRLVRFYHRFAHTSAKTSANFKEYQRFEPGSTSLRRKRNSLKRSILNLPKPKTHDLWQKTDDLVSAKTSANHFVGFDQMVTQSPLPLSSPPLSLF